MPPGSAPAPAPTRAGAADRAPGLVPARPRPGARTLLTTILLAALAASLLGVDLAGLRVEDSHAVRELLASVLRPELSADLLLGTLPAATLLTLSYAVAGMSVALVVGLPGAVLVSGALARRRATRVPVVGASRGVFAVLRAPHELLWALLLLQLVGPHPLAGIVAIGLPYGAVVARVLGERLQDVPETALAALRSAGASPAQQLLYGRVPFALSDMVGYLMYRLECAVRAAVVLTLIGLGGLGHEIEIALADLRYERVWTFVAALVLLIVVIDWLSARTRERITGGALG